MVEKICVTGEILKIDTGCIVALLKRFLDIQFVGGIKIPFSEEKVYSLHNYKIQVSLDSDASYQQISKQNFTICSPSGRREEGSVLGKLGNMLDGDRF